MLSKKRKVDIEGRIFNENWKDRYFFCEFNGKPVCLICAQPVAVAKEHNIKRHYETAHREKYAKFTGRLRTEKGNELEKALKKQQSAFTKSRETHDEAVKASYIIANKIAAAGKPYADGEFIRECMLAAAELVCPEKRQAFANISLSRRTMTDRIGDLAGDLHSQLQEKVKSFIAFSIAIDESTDVTDVAQLGIFIRGVDASLTVTEEFVEMVPMTDTTTANDIFSSLVSALDRLGVDWSRAVSVATDGAPSMVGKKAGVVAKLREKIQTENPEQEFWNFHCIIHQEALCSRSLKMDNVMDVVIKTVNFIRAKGLNHRQFDALLSENNIGHGLPYHTEVRWLSRGAVLKRFFQLRAEIGQFMDEKGRPVAELDDPDWLHDLAFLVDITEHLNVLNVNMQGRNKLVTQYYHNIRSFEAKLRVWERQLSRSNPANFSSLQSVCAAHGNNYNMDRYKDKISQLKSEFENRFQVFTQLEKEFLLFDSPFVVDAESDVDVPEELQMELIELQFDSALKYKFQTEGVESFYQYLGPRYPKLTGFASKILCMFGTTYLCEQAFSVMNMNKSKLRSQMTHKHLNDIMKIATAQKLVPDIDKIVKGKRCQVSKIANLM